MRRGFTLIELIVVIIIVGILAAVGISQYSRTVEKGRGSEAKMIIGEIREHAYEYWLTNGTLTGITNADVNIGTNASQIPEQSNCRSTHYYNYKIWTPDGILAAYTAFRCTSGGKPPQGQSGMDYELRERPSTGEYCWTAVGTGEGSGSSRCPGFGGGQW